MYILMIFLDGIGLGADDAEHNPFVAADLPTLQTLAGGQRWVTGAARRNTDRALFIPTDAVLGIEALRPASGSGQAALLTGRNIPQEIGEHYGPKPNQAIRDILDRDNLFISLAQRERSAALVTPYPTALHQAIQRGKRLPSSIQYCVLAAGLRLFDEQDYYRGDAISPDWTGEGWANHLGYSDAPLYTPAEVGQRLAELARQRDFTLFSTWITDEIGHRGPLERGIAYLERTDQVLAALLDAWQDDEGLILITSDHGNLEDLSHKRHTKNPVPTVIIGAERVAFGAGLTDLTHISPSILRFFEATR